MRESVQESRLPEPAGLPDEAARLLRVVSEMVRETRPGRAERVSLASHLERDLGLDSLARVELLLRIGNEFGRSLPESALADAETPNDLLRLIGRASAESFVSGPADLAVGAGSAGMPVHATTLVEVLEWYAGRTPDRVHVRLYGEDEHGEFRARTLTCGELLAEARRVASALVTRGLQPRQAVALMLPTGRDYLSSFFGVMLAGGIPVPIYPPARLGQIEDHLKRHARILANAEAVFMITVPQAKGVAALLRAEAPALSEILTPDELDGQAIGLLYRATAADIAFLQYTSGSTGDPKGVVLSHANLLANLRAMGEAVDVSSNDVFVSWLPLYHDMGLIGAWFGSLYFGMPLVLMSPLAFLSRPVRWLRAIAEHRGTVSAAPNFAYDLCARKLADADLEGLDLSSWRLALNGAEPVSPATLAAFADRFAPRGLHREAITPVYGLAECSVGLAFPALGRGPRIDRIDRQALVADRQALPAGAADPAPMEVPACGRVIPGHEIRIVDEQGSELPDRHVGRLQFRGPSATSGYYRNPTATQALFRNGWLDSGDFAYVVDGEIFLTGRVKDLIIRGGRNLYPYELEQAVGNLAGIRRGCVAVFASSDPANATERLIVLAETREDDPARREALRRQIDEVAVEVAGLPADEVVLAPPNSVLKTSSGKIRRAASREAFERGLIGIPGPSTRRQMLRLAAVALRARAGELGRRVARRVYGLWAWLVFVVLAIPVALLVTGLQAPAVGRRVVHFAGRVFLALCGIEIRADQAIEPPAGPHLLLVNHCSYLDSLVLFALVPPGADYRFVAKREFVSQRLIHAFLRGLGTLFVERFEAAKSVEDVDALVDALRDGQRLVIFPEGTFSREAGLKPFRMGAFVAAVRAAVPVWVGGLRGTRAVLRDRTWVPRRGSVDFACGPLLAPSGDDWAAAVRLRDATRRAMLELCGEHDLDR
ncbi:AMP-binding protein [Accumulibacter sp.]|uniref:AMP-binding protein n=1 Tax=Accumulibacter sp. TaxID=2053492 RepID=UPI0025ECDDDD|nr:AMP-binding protein [Accumulibacter sp.]MCM8595010.1 AMP-binding protein [Accumulibacter sp.]MDS4049156.1 AMP-binding protein [Accumulibacter sp.]